MSAYVYIEGGAVGANSKNLNVRCQQAFHKLLDGMGFTGRKPRLVPCGGRDGVYERFCVEHAGGKANYVAMWVDSEEPMANSENAWEHLRNVQTVSQWAKPEGADDEQVLFMTTCMETWIVADRATLREHYKAELHEDALPPTVNLENRQRHDIQNALSHATRDCSNAYEKGKRSFEILGQLDPAVLVQHLPSFVRVHRILNAKL